MRQFMSAVALVAIGPAAVFAQGSANVSSTPKLTGYLQPRFQAVGDSATFFLRRARFAVEGNITAWASYRAQVEMRTLGAPATPPASPLSLSATDLWIKMSHHRWGGTVGQFRVPFSLESLLSSTSLETTERSRIVNAAKRDIGMQAEWRPVDQVTLQTAVVNGEGPNRGSNPDNRMAYFARAVLTPFKRLDVGGAVRGRRAAEHGLRLPAVPPAAHRRPRGDQVPAHARTHVAVDDGRVVGLGDYEAHRVVDLFGSYLAPSLIDGHFHVESSMLTARAAGAATAMAAHARTAISARDPACKQPPALTSGSPRDGSP